jgi:hypothetical protein
VRECNAWDRRAKSCFKRLKPRGVGGQPVRTRQGYPIRYVGGDIIIDRPDATQDIYCGREGRAEAIRNGVFA